MNNLSNPLNNFEALETVLVADGAGLEAGTLGGAGVETLIWESEAVKFLGKN